MADDISPLAQRLAEAYDVDLTKLKEKHLGGKITARSVLDYLNAANSDAENRASEHFPDSISGSIPENSPAEADVPEDRLRKKSFLKDRASRKTPPSSGAATSTPEPAQKSAVTVEPAQPVNAEPEPTPAELAPTDEQAAPTEEAEPEKAVQKELKEQPRQETRHKKPEQKEAEQETSQVEPAPPTPLVPAQDATETVAALAKARAQLQVTAKVHQQALMKVGALREQNNALEAELEFLREAEAQSRSQLEAFQKHDEPLEVEVEPARRWRALAWLRRLFS